jgi:hypothetical protein
MARPPGLAAGQASRASITPMASESSVTVPLPGCSSRGTVASQAEPRLTHARMPRALGASGRSSSLRLRLFLASDSLSDWQAQARAAGTES